MAERIAFETDGFAVVVCRHPTTNNFLAVNESKNRGWWLPAGHVDKGQTFVEAAFRETQEEAGIDIQLKGVLAVEHSLSSSSTARMRVIFYAEPIDPTQCPKSIPDAESNGAAWLTLSEIESKKNKSPPEGLRGEELLNWGLYVATGGLIAPLSVNRNTGGYDGFFRLENDGPRYSGSVDSILLACDGGGGGGIGLAPLHMVGNAEAVHSVFGIQDTTQLRQALLTSDAPKVNEIGHSDKQWTALHRAVAEDSLERTRLLLLAGANPNFVTHKGRSALHFAASRRNLEIMRILLIAGADSNLRDQCSMTPADHLRIQDGEELHNATIVSILSLLGRPAL